MQPGHLVSAENFCIQHKIESSFINMLHENGLIEIITVEETSFIPDDHLPEVEKMMRLHYELNINIEGIEAVMHLLQRMEALQQEMIALKNRLRVYESLETN